MATMRPAKLGIGSETAGAATVSGGESRSGSVWGRVVCVLTGHGLKDPTTALARADSVVPCEADIGAVERAVLG